MGITNKQQVKLKAQQPCLTKLKSSAISALTPELPKLRTEAPSLLSRSPQQSAATQRSQAHKFPTELNGIMSFASDASQMW